MSSIVSRNPPPSGSTNQANDFFWISIRFGTSIDLSRRANVRRVRGASTEDKTATPRGDREEAASRAERTKLAARSRLRQGAMYAHEPVRPRLPYVAGRA